MRINCMFRIGYIRLIFKLFLEMAVILPIDKSSNLTVSANLVEQKAA